MLPKLAAFWEKNGKVAIFAIFHEDRDLVKVRKTFVQFSAGGKGRLEAATFAR